MDQPMFGRPRPITEEGLRAAAEKQARQAAYRDALNAQQRQKEAMTGGTKDSVGEQRRAPTNTNNNNMQQPPRGQPPQMVAEQLSKPHSYVGGAPMSGAVPPTWNVSPVKPPGASPGQLALLPSGTRIPTPPQQYDTTNPRHVGQSQASRREYVFEDGNIREVGHPRQSPPNMMPPPPPPPQDYPAYTHNMYAHASPQSDMRYANQYDVRTHADNAPQSRGLRSQSQDKGRQGPGNGTPYADPQRKESRQQSRNATRERQKEKELQSQLGAIERMREKEKRGWECEITKLRNELQNAKQRERDLKVQQQQTRAETAPIPIPKPKKSHHLAPLNGSRDWKKGTYVMPKNGGVVKASGGSRVPPGLPLGNKNNSTYSEDPDYPFRPITAPLEPLDDSYATPAQNAPPLKQSFGKNLFQKPMPTDKPVPMSAANLAEFVRLRIVTQAQAEQLWQMFSGFPIDIELDAQPTRTPNQRMPYFADSPASQESEGSELQTTTYHQEIDQEMGDLAEVYSQPASMAAKASQHHVVGGGGLRQQYDDVYQDERHGGGTLMS